jgi:4-amino-4-deoxy-L-arabinose transferase-like glycosyltransferase
MRTAGARTPFPPRRGQEKGGSGGDVAGAQLCPLAVLFVVAAKCALHLAVAGRYGWQRDELYYAVAGRHLQGGYVEFPPVTAWLSALARVPFGWSLIGFRAFAILAGAATIVVAALVARDLGGGRRAQTLAAVAVGFSPILVATNGLSSRSPSTSSRP